MAYGKTDLIQNKLLLKRFSLPIGAVTAQSYKRFHASDVGYSIPTGYYPVGMKYFNPGNSYLSIAYIQTQDVLSTNYLFSVRNDHASSSTGSGTTGTLDVVFAPEEIVKIITEDESSEPISDITSEPVFKIRQFTCAYTNLAANATKSFSTSDLGFVAPDGYDVFSFRNISTGNNNAAISCCNPFAESRSMAIRNRSSSAISSAYVRMGVAFINNKYKEHITIESAA